jgi:hypothetical protein
MNPIPRTAAIPIGSIYSLQISGAFSKVRRGFFVNLHLGINQISPLGLWRILKQAIFGPSMCRYLVSGYSTNWAGTI